MGNPDNWCACTGFRVEEVTTGLDLPVNLAFVPKPAATPHAPHFYVTELSGSVKVVTQDWNVHTYADSLLNYAPYRETPASEDGGVTGICVEPGSGDLFISMLYDEAGTHHGKVVRAHSSDGLHVESLSTVLESIPVSGKFHQGLAVSLGPDGMLYVNVADGGEAEAAQDMENFKGKILRLSRYGCVPPDNPWHGSPVYAYGFRNPPGAAWRRTDGSLYVCTKGPGRDDVVARVKPGRNHGWPMTMRQYSLFVWEQAQAPTALAFAQDGEFPVEYEGDLFVALFGDPYVRGRHDKGKKIVRLKLNEDGSGVHTYDEFVTYVGNGPASPCGLAFGPGGLYFTDFHGEQDGDYHGAGSVYRVSPLSNSTVSANPVTTKADSDANEVFESDPPFPPSPVVWG